MKRFPLLASLLIAALPLRAQAPAHTPDGRSFERLQSVTILPKTGAPFTAVVTTEWTRLLADGTSTTVKNHRTIARDSTGRIFQERRFLSPTGDVQETRLSNLQYADPSRHEFYDCIPATRVCTVSAYTTTAAVASELPASVALPNNMGTITREDLGRRTIDNLDVLGSRETTVLNPGVNGYQRAEPTIREFWYSPRLEINLITKRFEPRGGAQNFILQSINLDEPNPSLFTPPANYKIIRMNEQ